MNLNTSDIYWFVGATWDNIDQFDRFITNGIWENGYEDKLTEEVKSMAIGDHIAIKSSYTKKNGLTFDNRGSHVSVMLIKATGVITKNYNDGHKVAVNWTVLNEPKEWYFYTNRRTIWRITDTGDDSSALINFTFNGIPQDIDKFRNAPYWKERYGNVDSITTRFSWTKFYIAFADKLLEFKDKRIELINKIYEIASKVDGMSNLKDQDANNNTILLKDICPFTVIGMFNRGLTEDNRKIIAKYLADFLGVDQAIPNSFEGIL